MKVLFAASELYPVAKTGGLGDVAHALPCGLHRLGKDIRLVLPGYPQVLDSLRNWQAEETVYLSAGLTYQPLLGRIDDIPFPVWVVRADRIYRTTSDLYPADPLNRFHRFLTLSHASAHLAAGGSRTGWRPDVLHANDWHTGMAFNMLDALSCDDVARVFSLHNIAFAGDFPLSYAALFLSETGPLRGTLYRKWDKVSFLEEAFIAADKIVTVSPRYAEEITGPEFGFGFETLLRRRRRDLSGILNGVDYGVWHPEQDPALPFPGASFGGDDKRAAKRLIQQRFGLPLRPDSVLCSFTNRLTHQKMIDVVMAAAERLAGTRFQFVFHGMGEPQYQDHLKALSGRYPEAIAYVPGFNETLEHMMLAGADLCLSPSRFEPCGLNALYAMRYGAVPVVCPVGGFRDTIRNEFSVKQKATGNGFYMDGETGADLADVLIRIERLMDDGPYWSQLVDTVKRQHFSWRHAAQRYVALYTAAIEARRLRAPEAANRLAQAV